MVMDLMTKCPQCGTVFSASMDELQLRKGYIRCVNCAYIFDGYDAVVPQGPNTAATAVQSSVPTRAPPIVETPAKVPMQAPPAVADELPHVVRQRAPVATASGSHAPAAATAEPRIPPKQMAAMPIVSEPIQRSTNRIRNTEPALGRPMPFSVDGPKPDPYFDRGLLDHDVRKPSGIYIEPQDKDEFRLDDDDRATAHSSDRLPDFLHTGRVHRSALGRLFWSVLILIGLVCLIAQLMFVYRMQIASNVPMLRPLLEQACEPLRCKVGYPRRIERIAIMDSSLQAAPHVGEANADDSALLLRVVLRNNYDKPQTWPSLTLDLVDFSGAVVARRTLAPSAYLASQTLSGPFPARSEIHIAVPVTVSGVKINGYQLGKFYPPEG